MNNIKILHIAPAYCSTGGGIYEMIENLSRTQTLNKLAEVDILCTCLYEYSDTDTDINVHNLLPYHISDIFNIYKSIVFMMSKLSEYQIIHVHGAWSLQYLLVAPFLKKYRNKTIYQPHGLLDPVRTKKGWFKKFIAQIFYQKKINSYNICIMACSQKEEDELRSYFVGRKQIRHIPNGISSDFFDKKTKINKIEKNRILFLSQIIPVKNLENSIKSIAYLKNRYNQNLYLDIYGYGQKKYIDTLIKLSKELCIDENILFKGSVPRSERIELYDKYHIFLLPSLSENFAIVVLEALSRGCNVVTSAMTPWKSYKHDRLHITEVDPISIATKIYYLNNLKEEDKNCSNSRVPLHLNRYNWNSIAKSYDIFYKEILNISLIA